VTYLPRQSLGAALLDKTPGSSVDIVATWAGIKDYLRTLLGEYRFADNTLRTFFGQRLPMATVQHAVVIHDWLNRAAKKMMAAAQRAGRPSSKMQAALTQYNAAFAKFKSTARDSFGGRMPLETCYAWIDATDRFAIDLSAAQYVAFSTGTPAELMQEALDETPGGALIQGAWAAGKTAANTLSFAFRNLNTIIKLGALLGAGLVGYRIYNAKPWEKLLGTKKEAPAD
jgi:hypothetical protein